MGKTSLNPKIFECGYYSPILNLSSKTMSNNKQMSDMK